MPLNRAEMQRMARRLVFAQAVAVGGAWISGLLILTLAHKVDEPTEPGLVGGSVAVGCLMFGLGFIGFLVWFCSVGAVRGGAR